MAAQNQTIIFVAGATGKQGSAVTKSLLQKGFIVKALARNAASPQALALEYMGAEIVEGDLNNPASFSDHLKNADGIFCVLTFKNGTAVEIKQGFQLADLAKKYNVPHFLYSSVIAADLNTGVPHWESKFTIENYIKSTGIPHTIIRPTSLYENFLIAPLKKRILKGTFLSPVAKNVVQQYISARDIGEISARIFMNKDEYLHKTFAIAAEQIGIAEIIDAFTAVTGRKVKFQSIPPFIVRLVLGKSVYKIVKWVNGHSGIFVHDLAAFKTEFPGMLTLREWIAQNFI